MKPMMAIATGTQRRRSCTVASLSGGRPHSLAAYANNRRTPSTLSIGNRSTFTASP
jgi:hypothetical protein